MAKKVKKLAVPQVVYGLTQFDEYGKPGESYTSFSENPSGFVGYNKDRVVLNKYVLAGQVEVHIEVEDVVA